MPKSEPELLLAQVEEKYGKAATIQYEVVKQEFLEAGADNDSDRREFVVRAKIGGKFLVTAAASATSSKVTIVSDGSQCALRNERSIVMRGEASRFSDQYLRVGMVRAGLFLALTTITAEPPVADNAEFAVSDVTFEPVGDSGSAAVKTLKFTLRVCTTNEQCSVRMHIDVETLVIQWQELKWNSRRVVLNYRTVKFDEEIPDGEFAISPEK